MSNSRNVLAQLPPKDKVGSPGIWQPFDLVLDSLPVKRALGVLWNVDQDTLEIIVVPKQLAPTKRGVLKQTSTIFDPLGLIAPFVLRATLVLQELWRLGFDWDKPISGPLLDAWEAWKAELPILATLSVPRCYLSNQVPSMQTRKFTSSLMPQRSPLVPLPTGDLKHGVIPITAPSYSERQGLLRLSP